MSEPRPSPMIVSPPGLPITAAMAAPTGSENDSPGATGRMPGLFRSGSPPPPGKPGEAGRDGPAPAAGAGGAWAEVGPGTPAEGGDGRGARPAGELAAAGEHLGVRRKRAPRRETEQARVLEDE